MGGISSTEPINGLLRSPVDVGAEVRWVKGRALRYFMSRALSGVGKMMDEDEGWVR